MNAGRTVAFHTLGCKLNFSETSTIGRDFEQAGYRRVDFDDTADVYVINTCSVTDNADKRCRAIVRKAKRLSPDSFVAMIGCYAQLKPQEIAEMEGVDIVLGAAEKFNLPEHMAMLDRNDKAIAKACDVMDVKDFKPSFSLGDRTRSFLKVQDGCDYFCAFCTIPFARGRSRSSSVEQVVDQAEQIGRSGVREVVLTGVNIGDFKGPKGETFFDLVKSLDQIESIERFRISSIEPNLLTNEVIDLVANSTRFVPHFHIPLQSGSDRMLERMRRKYVSQLYRDRVNRIKEVMPDACIGADVIVGFPGEDDEAFNETVDFLKSIDVSYLHVFTYSERPGTTALRLDGVVPMGKRQERSRILHQLSDKMKRAFYERFAGTTRTVLWENAEKDGELHGFTDNYIKASRIYDADRCNTVEQVQLGPVNHSAMVIDALEKETLPV